MYGQWLRNINLQRSVGLTGGFCNLRLWDSSSLWRLLSLRYCEHLVLGNLNIGRVGSLLIQFFDATQRGKIAKRTFG